MLNTLFLYKLLYILFIIISYSNIMKKEIQSSNITSTIINTTSNTTIGNSNVITDMKETEDHKEKFNNITTKYIAVRKERDNLKKENKELHNEILILQANIRQMIPGFSSNTSSSFPMLNELQNKLSQFYKCDCQDIFFDLLCPELNMEGLIFFFKESFTKIQSNINSYFDPLSLLIKKTICIDEIWSSIDNVLRKSYQSNWKKILGQIFNDNMYHTIMLYIQNNLKLQEEDSSANSQIIEFLKCSSVSLFFCYISDPCLQIDIKTIGETVHFNSIKHETIDGFAKPKQECIILLPACYNLHNEMMIIKSQVLPLDYEFP